jgi:serine/threonine-protein kinase RsbW
VRIESRLELLPEVREEAVGRAREAGFRRQAAEDIALCVHEAVVNAIRHGNKGDPKRTVTVSYHDRPDRFEVEVCDEGESVTGGAGPATEPQAPEHTHGRGLHLMRALMDEIELAEDVGRIVLRRVKDTGSMEPPQC